MAPARPTVALAALLSVCALVAPAAGAAPFVKGPYLQHLGDTDVVVKFELDESALASVDVVDAATHAAHAAAAASPATFHALHVTGLAPSTSYTYTVTVGEGAGAKPSEAGHFTTAPSDGRPIKFLLYGDSRSDDATHAAVLRAMSERPADFLVNTGDIVYRGSDPKEWQSFFQVEGATLRDQCLFAVIGNHELVGGHAGEAAFLRYFAPGDADGAARPYGTFRWGNTRFFVLNAMDEFAAGPERAWLEEALSHAAAEAGVAHRIAVLHHGPFSSGPHHGNQRLGTVVRLLRDRGVELILAGHDHIYERGEGAGIKYVVSGGAGAPLYLREAATPETQAFESVHHFVEFAIDGDKVTAIARRAVGGVIETCSYTRGTPWSCDAGSSADRATDVAPPPRSSTAGHSGAAGCGCRMGSSDDGPGGRAMWVVGAALALLASRRVLRRTSPTHEHRREPP